MVGNGVNFENADLLDFDKGNGLIPAIVQHAGTRGVLMVGYMNRDALIATLTRRRVVFFSRAMGRLWEKGETSGHSLELEEIRRDCDHDALLVRAWPHGHTCHLGASSCFGDAADIESGSHAFLTTLERVIGDRASERPDKSYTARLLSAGCARVGQRVGEEGVEVALAAVSGTDQDVIDETADLIYHLLVLLQARGLKLQKVIKELESRYKGHFGPPSQTAA